MTKGQLILTAIITLSVLGTFLGITAYEVLTNGPYAGDFAKELLTLLTIVLGGGGVAAAAAHGKNLSR